jgi:predicted secreted Zn-dependent protease
MLKHIALALVVLLGLVLPAGAANVVRSYSYFSIGGSTLDEIEAELSRHGPLLNSSGNRHPGATRMQFTTRIGYEDRGTSCRIAQANVTVKAKVILPKWRRSKRADQDVRLIWDTLAADIKRHEESHVSIAKGFARDLETELLAIGRQPDCNRAAEKAKAVTTAMLARHDKAQDRFDRIEAVNFESRLLRLLRYRLEQSTMRKAQ